MTERWVDERPGRSPLTEEDLLDLHSEVLADINPRSAGRFRDGRVLIKGTRFVSVDRRSPGPLPAPGDLRSSRTGGSGPRRTSGSTDVRLVLRPPLRSLLDADDHCRLVVDQGGRVTEGLSSLFEGPENLDGGPVSMLANDLQDLGYPEESPIAPLGLEEAVGDQQEEVPRGSCTGGPVSTTISSSMPRIRPVLSRVWTVPALSITNPQWPAPA